MNDNNFYKVKTLLKIIVILFFTISIACKKKKEPNSSNLIKDLKGPVSLYVKVLHHAMPLSNINVYIKIDTTFFDTTSIQNYDYKKVSDAYGNVLFDSLPYLNCFIYATGYDPNVQKSVLGYGPVFLNTQTVGSDLEYTQTLYVSEIH